MEKDKMERRKELEKELELQKQRFFQAAKKSTEAVQQGLVLTNWVRAYPVETSLFLMFAGFVTSIILYPEELRE